MMTTNHLCCEHGLSSHVLQDGAPHEYERHFAGGQVVFQEYQVFPGIWLTFTDAHSSEVVMHDVYPAGMLEILHCRKGRVEYQEGECFYFLGEGDMSVHCYGTTSGQLSHPTHHFHGLAVLIHPDLAPTCTSALLEDVEVSLPQLYERFGGENGPMVMRAAPQLEHLFDELYHVPPAIRKGYFKVKILELLLFLSTLEPSREQTVQRTCSPRQVALAQAVMGYVSEHSDRHLRAEDLAQALHASPEQLRRSVQRVYGMPLAQCVRAYKMRLAARALRETERTVADLAGEFGYDNSSKFARAFKQTLGVSPDAYRRGETMCILERKTSDLEQMPEQEKTYNNRQKM